MSSTSTGGYNRQPTRLLQRMAAKATGPYLSCATAVSKYGVSAPIGVGVAVLSAMLRLLLAVVFSTLAGRNTFRYFTTGQGAGRAFSSVENAFRAYFFRVKADGKIGYCVTRVAVAFAGGLVEGVVLTPLHVCGTVLGGLGGGIYEYGMLPLPLTAVLNGSVNAALHSGTYFIRNAFASANAAYHDVSHLPRYHGRSLFMSDLENVANVTWRKNPGAALDHLFGREKTRSFPLTESRASVEQSVLPPAPVTTASPSSTWKKTPDRSSFPDGSRPSLKVSVEYDRSLMSPFGKQPYAGSHYQGPTQMSSSSIRPVQFSAHYNALPRTPTMTTYETPRQPNPRKQAALISTATHQIVSAVIAKKIGNKKT